MFITQLFESDTPSTGLAVFNQLIQAVDKNSDGEISIGTERKFLTAREAGYLLGQFRKISKQKDKSAGLEFLGSVEAIEQCLEAIDGKEAVAEDSFANADVYAEPSNFQVREMDKTQMPIGSPKSFATKEAAVAYAKECKAERPDHKFSLYRLANVNDHNDDGAQATGEIFSAEIQNTMTGGIRTVQIRVDDPADGSPEVAAMEYLQPHEYIKRLSAKQGTIDVVEEANTLTEEYQAQYKTKEEAIAYAKERVKEFRDPIDGIEIWQLPTGFDVVNTMNANGRNHVVDNGGKKLGTVYQQKSSVKEVAAGGSMKRVFHNGQWVDPKTIQDVKEATDWKEYERKVAALEKKGLSRSDAQGVVDAQMMNQKNVDEGRDGVYHESNPKIDLFNKETKQYLGSTNWYQTVATAVQSYVEKHPELAGKVIGKKNIKEHGGGVNDVGGYVDWRKSANKERGITKSQPVGKTTKEVPSIPKGTVHGKLNTAKGVVPEGAIDDLEQRRIEDLQIKMDDLKARGARALGDSNQELFQALKREYDKLKAERDSYYKVNVEEHGGGVNGVKHWQAAMEDTVSVPHGGKMVTGKVVRFDKGNPESPFYVVDIGERESIKVPAHKVKKSTDEAANPAQQAAIAVAMKKAHKKPKSVDEAQTDYQKRRQRERDVDAGKPVSRAPKNPQTDYAKKRAQDKRDMELGEGNPNTDPWYAYDTEDKTKVKKFKSWAGAKKFEQSNPGWKAVSAGHFHDKVKTQVNEAGKSDESIIRSIMSQIHVDGGGGNLSYMIELNAPTMDKLREKYHDDLYALLSQTSPKELAQAANELRAMFNRINEGTVNPQFINAQVTKILAGEARRMTNAPMAQLLAPVMKEYNLTLQQIDSMVPGGLKRAAGSYGIMMKEGFQDFNKVEPYAVCLAGKPVKNFDYYEEARKFHDNWKQKLYREGNKEKADKITLNPIMKESTDKELADFLRHEHNGDYEPHSRKRTPNKNKWHDEDEVLGQDDKPSNLGEDADVIPSSQPRNFVVKNMKQSGQGKHKDVKKAQKQGDFKHKRDAIPTDEGTMSSASHNPTGPKFGGYWKGTDKAPPRPGQGFGGAEESEGDDGNPVESAILRRIMAQHRDALMKYGPQAIMNAAREEAEWVGDVEELGTSDISAMVKRVIDTLDTNVNEADPCWKGYKQIGMKDKSGKQVPNCVPVDEDTEDKDELKPGEYYIWTVYFDDGSSTQVKVKNGDVDVKALYAKKGKNVVNVEYNWTPHN